MTYTSTNVSVRTSGKLSGGYDGASGSNKIFFGSAPATFDINNITMPAGKTNYRIIFGGAYSQSNGGTYDNIFKPESFHVAVGNGTDWSGNLTYEKIGGSDTTDPYWVQFAVDFTLKELSASFRSVSRLIWRRYLQSMTYNSSRATAVRRSISKAVWFRPIRVRLRPLPFPS